MDYEPIEHLDIDLDEFDETTQDEQSKLIKALEESHIGNLLDTVDFDTKGKVMAVNTELFKQWKKFKGLNIYL